MKFSKKTTAIILVATVMNYNLPALMVYGSELGEDKNVVTKVENEENNTGEINELKEVINNEQVSIQDEIVENNNEEFKVFEDGTMEMAADVTVPVLDISSLTVDKKDSKVGDNVKVSFKVTDDMSGVKNVFLYYATPITGKTHSIRMAYNKDTGLYEGYINIDEMTESGEWKIKWIYLCDKVSNEVSIRNSNFYSSGDIIEDLSAGNFNVSETTADVTVPTLDISSLTVDKKDSKVGDNVKVSFKVTDDMSGVKNVFLYYATPITGKTHSIRMAYNKDTGLYEGYINIDEMTESGEWKIKWIYLCDKVSNEVSIRNSNFYSSGDIIEDLSAGNFNVNENNEPTITANDITIKVGDKFDAKSIATANDVEDGDITSKIEVIKNTVDTTKVGVYEVTYKVIDNNGASCEKTIKVTVENNIIVDTTPPTLDVSSLIVDKKEVTVGERVKLSFKATDDISGIKSAKIWYYSPVTGKSKGISMTYNKNTNLYEGYIDVNEMTEAGEWKIQYIYLSDSVSNQTYIYNSNIKNYGDIKENLSAGDFTVNETISDVTAPVLDISSLTVDKKEATVGDRVNLSFKATDNMSEIKYARIWYYTPTGKTKRILMTYNKNTGFYEGHIDIDKTTEIGEWKIQYVYLSDSVSNQSYIYNSNVKNYGDIEEDLSIGDFNIR